MVISDVKFEKFQLASPAVLANLKRFRQVTRDEGMDFVASVAPFGYADAMLSNDPNLAEGRHVGTTPPVIPMRSAQRAFPLFMVVVRRPMLGPYGFRSQMRTRRRRIWPASV